MGESEDFLDSHSKLLTDKKKKKKLSSLINKKNVITLLWHEENKTLQDMSSLVKN